MTKEELVNLCKEGNEQALSLLYKTYANKMKRICSQYISDKQTVSVHIPEHTRSLSGNL